jgi:hypothetical protein
MSKVPDGYIGHARDLAKGKCVRDPDVRFKGPKGSSRVLLRTDGFYIVCLDRGPEHFGADRYEERELHSVLSEATEAARLLVCLK